MADLRYKKKSADDERFFFLQPMSHENEKFKENFDTGFRV